jgi:hypothetical protein
MSAKKTKTIATHDRGGNLTGSLATGGKTDIPTPANNGVTMVELSSTEIATSPDLPALIREKFETATKAKQPKVVYDWATKEKPAEATIESNCVCVYCDKCEMMTTGDTCSECGESTRYVDDCTGCYDEAKADLRDNIYEEWLLRNGGPAFVRIDVTGMGWRSVSASTTIPADFDRVFGNLTLNGDWKLNFVFADKSLVATRSSHDEPTGGCEFIFLPAGNSCEECGEMCGLKSTICPDCKRSSKRSEHV